jgi:hypothetical protein
VDDRVLIALPYDRKGIHGRTAKIVTHEQMVRRIMKRTGYPERAVRIMLDAQVKLLREALVGQGTVTFRTLFRVTAEDREISVQIPGQGRRRIRRIMLHAKPIAGFRAELNAFTREEPMNKYGVVTEDQAEKVATSGSRPCPSCGSGKVDWKAATPWCPNCGTLPWEPHKHKDEQKK